MSVVEICVSFGEKRADIKKWENRASIQKLIMIRSFTFLRKRHPLLLLCKIIPKKCHEKGNSVKAKER
jgi:hypothetical protein